MAKVPTKNIIDRDDADQHNTNEHQSINSDIVVECLSERHYLAARDIENEFLAAGKGCCFGCLPYALCPLSSWEFEGIYRQSPDDRSKTYGVAVRVEDQKVLGICKLRMKDQPSTWDENWVHTVTDEKECYLDSMAVTKEARGRGVGTKLLNWAEEVAKDRQKQKMALGVVNGNPAKRLYERQGYKDVGKDGIVVSFLLGRPNGQFGAVLMEKSLSTIE